MDDTTMAITGVVTWQSARGAKLNICRTCERHLKQQHAWPKDSRGEEYAQIHMGQHRGVCETSMHAELQRARRREQSIRELHRVGCPAAEWDHIGKHFNKPRPACTCGADAARAERLRNENSRA